MLKITVTAEEEFDDEKQEFLPPVPPTELTLEHSLISLSKWESKWQIPYLSSNLTMEQTKDYVRCMCLTQNVPDEVFERLSPQVINQVAEYIKNPMTATWFGEDKLKTPHRNGRMNGEIVTAEIIYYWMTQMNIPWECQKWHLNRLLTLVRVIGDKNSPPKKMSQAEIVRRYADLNAQRKAKYHTRG